MRIEALASVAGRVVHDLQGLLPFGGALVDFEEELAPSPGRNTIREMRSTAAQDSNSAGTFFNRMDLFQLRNDNECLVAPATESGETYLNEEVPVVPEVIRVANHITRFLKEMCQCVTAFLINVNSDNSESDSLLVRNICVPCFIEVHHIDSIATLSRNVSVMKGRNFWAIIAATCLGTEECSVTKVNEDMTVEVSHTASLFITNVSIRLEKSHSQSKEGLHDLIRKDGQVETTRKTDRPLDTVSLRHVLNHYVQSIVAFRKISNVHLF